MTLLINKYKCDVHIINSDVYIALKGRTTIEGTNDAKERNKSLSFKNNVPFRSSILKINNGDLDIVMSMNNLLRCSDNYAMASGSLWNCYSHEMNDAANEDDAT